MDFKHKKITVIGLGSSGKYSALLAHDLGAKVSITESQETPAVGENLKFFQGLDVKIEIGRHTKDLILGRDLIITSPGVSSDSSPIKWAQELNIPVISEIEFAYLLCPAPIIATTGTNGKTTVTTLIGEVLKKTGRRVFVCGNIGLPFTKVVSQIKKEDFVSLEVSSFQLERIIKFQPKVALILNFTLDHLNRHSDMDEYLAAKKRIFLNQDKEDWAILNYQDEIVRSLGSQTRAKVLFFNKDTSVNPNFQAAQLVGQIFGVDQKDCEGIFNSFKGLAHRLEFIDSINGIDFINDSKATNVDSTVWALNRIDKTIILIAGGRDKGADFKVIYDLIKKKVKHLVVIGEATDKIKTHLTGATSIEEADSIGMAINKSFLKAKRGDCILLSPMCASFDMFLNYEDRGDTFKKEVLNFKRASQKCRP